MRRGVAREELLEGFEFLGVPLNVALFFYSLGFLTVKN